MANSWNEVRATQAFLDSSPEKREAIRQDYFQQVVAPNAQAKGLDVDSVYRDYMANTDVTPYYNHESKADMSTGEWLNNQWEQVKDLGKGAEAYVNKWSGADYSNEDINQFKRAIGSDEGEALKTTAAIGASVVAPELIPELAGGALVGEGANLASRSIWLANSAASNIASSAAYRLVDSGDVNASTLATDAAIGMGLEGGLRGVAHFPSLFKAKSADVMAAAGATARAQHDVDTLINAKKNAYTASANTATLESVWNALKEENPNIHFDEVLAEWGEKEPAMMKGSHSQLQRLQDTLFPDGVPEGLTTEALKSRIKAASLQTQRDLLAAKNEFPLESPAVAIRAMESMREVGLGVPNISMLSKDLANDLNMNDSAIDKLLNWSESYSFISPYFRKKTADKAIRNILDSSINMIDKVAERDLLQSRNIDSDIPVGDSLDHVLHGSKSRAFNYRSINTQKLLKKLRELKGSARLNPDNFGSMISEAQDLVYGESAVSELSQVRDNLAVVNLINQMKKTGDAPFAIKILLAKATGTVPDLLTFPIKYIKDRSRASAAILGKKLYHEHGNVLDEMNDINYDLQQWGDMLTDEEKANNYKRLKELRADEGLQDYILSEIAKDSEFAKRLKILLLAVPVVRAAAPSISAQLREANNS